MARQPRGTVKFRPGGDGRPGAWWGRFTASDGSRPWVRARERGRTVRKVELVREKRPPTTHRASGRRGSSRRRSAVRRRGPCGWERLRGGTTTSSIARRSASTSSEGAYLTHIQPVLDKPLRGDHPRRLRALARRARRQDAGRQGLGEDDVQRVGRVHDCSEGGCRAVEEGQAEEAASATRQPVPRHRSAGHGRPRRSSSGCTPTSSCACFRAGSCRSRRAGSTRSRVYLFVRAGELKALDWTDVDMERGIVSIRVAWDRDRDEVKQTKTGEQGHPALRDRAEPAAAPARRCTPRRKALGAVDHDAAAEVVGGGPAQAPRGAQKSTAPRSSATTRPASACASTTSAAPVSPGWPSAATTRSRSSSAPVTRRSR